MENSITIDCYDRCVRKILVYDYDLTNFCSVGVTDLGFCGDIQVSVDSICIRSKFFKSQ